MPRALDEPERRSIADAIRSGGKRNEVARQFGRSPGVVSKIVRAEGIDLERSQTKKATEAKRVNAQDKRLEILNEGFSRARDILPDIQEPKELKDWMLAVGTLIDKRRNEEGR